MNILLTNDDGYLAVGLRAAWNALRNLGRVYIVAPLAECSACGHRISLRRTVSVHRKWVEPMGEVFAVDGSPADCVRLAIAELIERPIDWVISGVNAGANSGVDVFYSGTVAGAREAAILSIPSMAVSQSLRTGVETDWDAVGGITSLLVQQIMAERMPGRGLWNINLPAPLPDNARELVHRVALEPVPPLLQFDRTERENGQVLDFRDTATYWSRPAESMTDYAVIRDGGIAVTFVPLFGYPQH